MLPPPIRETADLIRRLPGIGPRQALRCAFYILRRPQEREDLKRALENISNIGNCEKCFRAISITQNTAQRLCTSCHDPKRANGTLCVVEEDTDLEQLEKAAVFKGQYFVLGGRLSIAYHPQSIRINELKQRVSSDQNLKEIILALSPTSEGNAAALWLKQAVIESASSSENVKITRLGIGMPSGGEIEYADEETLRGAMKNRN